MMSYFLLSFTVLYLFLLPDSVFGVESESILFMGGKRRRLLVRRQVRQLPAHPQALLAVRLAHGVRGIVTEPPWSPRWSAGSPRQQSKLGVHVGHAELLRRGQLLVRGGAEQRPAVDRRLVRRGGRGLRVVMMQRLCVWACVIRCRATEWW